MVRAFAHKRNSSTLTTPRFCSTRFFSSKGVGFVVEDWMTRTTESKRLNFLMCYGYGKVCRRSRDRSQWRVSGVTNWPDGRLSDEKGLGGMLRDERGSSTVLGAPAGLLGPALDDGEPSATLLRPSRLDRKAVARLAVPLPWPEDDTAAAEVDDADDAAGKAVSESLSLLLYGLGPRWRSERSEPLRRLWLDSECWNVISM